MRGGIIRGHPPTSVGIGALRRIFSHEYFELTRMIFEKLTFFVKIRGYSCQSVANFIF